MSLPFTDNFSIYSAQTSDVAVADAIAYDVSKRQKMSIQFTCASHTAGNGVFTVYVSNDGVNFVQYNRLTSNVTNTNAQNDTRVASVTLSSNTSVIYFFPPGDYFRMIKVALDVTTDGAYSCQLEAAG